MEVRWVEQIMRPVRKINLPYEIGKTGLEVMWWIRDRTEMFRRQN